MVINLNGSIFDIEIQKKKKKWIDFPLYLHLF